MASAVQSTGLMAQVKLAVAQEKSVPSLLTFLRRRWEQGAEQTSQKDKLQGIETMRIYPRQSAASTSASLSPSSASAAAKGWGWDCTSTTIQDIFTQLASPDPFELEYAWTPAGAAHVSAAAAAAAPPPMLAAQPLPLPVSLAPPVVSAPVSSSAALFGAAPLWSGADTAAGLAAALAPTSLAPASSAGLGYAPAVTASGLLASSSAALLGPPQPVTLPATPQKERGSGSPAAAAAAGDDGSGRDPALPQLLRSATTGGETGLHGRRPPPAHRDFLLAFGAPSMEESHDSFSLGFALGGPDAGNILDPSRLPEVGCHARMEI